MKQKKTLLTISLVIIVFISLSFNGYSQETNISKIKQEIAEKGIKEFIKEIDKSPSINKAENIKLMGELKDPRLVKPIIDKFLKDKSENEQVRSAAAHALGEINDQKALKPLMKSLRKDNSAIVRLEAAAALGKIGSPSAVKPLIEALKKDEDNKVREVSAITLTRIKDPAGINSLIKILYLKDADLSKIYAIKALGMAKDIRAVKPLNSQLSSRSNRQVDVQIEAVKAIGEIKHKTSIRHLETALKSNQIELQKEAARALYKYGVMNLKNAVYSSRSASAAEAAKEALVNIGDPAVEQLFGFKTLPDYVISALVEIGSPAAVELLIHSLKSSSDPYREKIEASLLTIGEPVVKSLAEVRLDVDNFLMDSKMMYAKRKETSRKLKKEIDSILTELGYEPSPEDQVAYLISAKDWNKLIEMGKPAVEPLIFALNHKDSKTRHGAVIALGKIKDTKAVEPLINVLNNDTDYAVRKQAAFALGEINDSRAINPLITAAEEDTRVDTWAISALLKMKATNPRAIKLYIGTFRRGTDTQRLKSAEIILKSKDPQAVKARKQALNAIANLTYITETINYDKLGRPESCVLKNTDGKEIAKKRFLFSRYIATQKTGEIITDLSTGKDIYTKMYDEYGKAKNPMWLCLDKKGNVIKRAGKAVLVKTFIAQQKSELKNVYNGAFLEKRITMIYPCKNCAGHTGIKNCKYVW